MPVAIDSAPFGMEVPPAQISRELKKLWEREVFFCISQLKLSFIADYVTVGVGNAKLLSRLPNGVQLGHNRNAYLGGCRMWENDTRTRRAKWQVI